MGLYRELSGGLSGRPAGIPSAWWYGRRSRCFLHRLFPNTLNHVFWLLAGGRTIFFISKDGVIGKAPRLREEAFLEVWWQSRRPTIAVLGLPSSFLLKSSVRWKRCDVTAAYSGPLASKVFSGVKNITSMKSWHSILALKIGEISNVLWTLRTMAQFL